MRHIGGFLDFRRCQRALVERGVRTRRWWDAEEDSNLWGMFNLLALLNHRSGVGLNDEAAHQLRLRIYERGLAGTLASPLADESGGRVAGVAGVFDLILYSLSYRE